jgi:4-hydroxy-2-oxoglutarate aldolase
MSLDFHGVFPPMITPFKENGEVDDEAFVENVERWNSSSLAGVLVLGSNSETAYLTEEEKLKLIELTVHTAGKGRVLLAGTGVESTRETIRLTNKAAALGIHAALVLTPCYYSDHMSDAALIQHFTRIADASDIPILIYNVPKFTHINVGVNVLKVLSQHPNIIGMKDSAGNVQQVASNMMNVSPRFQILVGNAAVWMPVLPLGIRAGVLALANCVPDLCAEIQSLYEHNEVGKARTLYLRLLPVNHAVTASYGIAGLKYVCDLLGYRGGCVRSPLLPLTEKAKEELRGILRTAELL